MIAERIGRIFGAATDSVNKISDSIGKKIEGKAEAATIFVIDKLAKATSAAVDYLDRDKKEK
jgi:hypothetical protein